MAVKVEPDVWYTADETAELLSISQKTLEAERMRGGGCPYSKIGRRIYYLGSDLLGFIESKRRRSTADRPVEVAGTYRER